LKKNAGSSISVIIPTLKRPQLLSRAVESVLSQELPDGAGLEVIIALSNPDDTQDRAVADDLSGDPRVRIAPAPRGGAGAARNAGIRAAAGWAIALMDDDCQAQPGWLASGWRALQDADLVQGRTAPERPTTGYEHTVSVDPLSGQWETCNLFFRKELFERIGGYDEEWNSEGKVGSQYGEDVEWGWRAVRGGARTAAAPEALVHHVVQPRTYVQYLHFMSTRVASFPRLLRTTPELRGRYYRQYFFNRRHVRMAASTGIAGTAMIAGVARMPRTGIGLAIFAVGLSVFPYRRELLKPNPRESVSRVASMMLTEWVCFASLAAASARWRRVLL
jgi:glycosyltransferase involved in cell wall biosynthesis